MERSFLFFIIGWCNYRVNSLRWDISALGRGVVIAGEFIGENPKRSLASDRVNFMRETVAQEEGDNEKG